MVHVGLFSGIGGFEIAGEWMGWENAFHCEWNPFARKILKYYFKNSKCYEDITRTDFSIWRGRADILTGGFPCQPFSTAGKRQGKDDNRYLWDEMLRVIDEVQPPWVIGENVAGITSMVFDQNEIGLESQANNDGETISLSMEANGVLLSITKDLESRGYSVQCFIIPACAVNAPHRRDRIWIIAHSDSYGHKLRRLGKNRPTSRKGCQKGNKWQRLWHDIRGIGKPQNASLASSKRRNNGGDNREKRHVQTNAVRNPKKAQSKWDKRKFGFSKIGATYANSNTVDAQRGYGQAKKMRKKSRQSTFRFGEPTKWETFPAESPICGRNDGLPTELDGITLSKWTKESLKGFGNAVVPQEVFEIFQMIEQVNNQFKQPGA